MYNFYIYELSPKNILNSKIIYKYKLDYTIVIINVAQYYIFVHLFLI